jgi:SAM-dependent methyltransferase
MHQFLLPLFLRRRAPGRDPLPVVMCGIRAGERVLQIGLDDPALAAALASKAGLNGTAALAAASAAAAGRARRAAAAAGVLMEVATARLPLPLGNGGFDLVVVHALKGVPAALGPLAPPDLFRECRRVLRAGGRVIVIETGAGGGLTAVLRRRRQASGGLSRGTTADLEAAGFGPVRVLGEREGYKFTEGITRG